MDDDEKEENYFSTAVVFWEIKLSTGRSQTI